MPHARPSGTWLPQSEIRSSRNWTVGRRHPDGSDSLPPHQYNTRMAICVTDITALEAYRSSGRLLPTLLDKPRTAKLENLAVPPTLMLADSMQSLGAESVPYHLLFSSPNQAQARPDIRRHVHEGELPRRSIIKIKKDLLIVSPEFLFFELASSSAFDEVDLAMTGLELCGTYTLDPDDQSWTGLISTGTTMTSVKKIGRMLEKLDGRKGVARARKALRLVRDASNSPMETVLVALLCFPRRLGGLGLGPVELNRKVPTSAGDRWVDLFFLDQRVGIEYKGRKSHSIEKTGRDDRRQNKLVGSGVKVLNVWYEDLFDDHLFQQLMKDVSDALGVRLRIRSDSFEQRQKLLRMRLMPAIERFGS